MRRIIVAFKESTVSDYTYGIKLRLHTAINRADFVSWWSNIYRTRKRSLPRYQNTEKCVDFEVFWDRGKELFRVLYIASQTNQYLKRKLKWKLS